MLLLQSLIAAVCDSGPFLFSGGLCFLLFGPCWALLVDDGKRVMGCHIQWTFFISGCLEFTCRNDLLKVLGFGAGSTLGDIFLLTLQAFEVILRYDFAQCNIY